MPSGSGERAKRGTDRRAAIWAAIPFLMLPPSLAPAKNVLPVPAPDAGTSGAELQITHTHRVVTACRLENRASDLGCVAKLVPGEAETKLVLIPIPPASLERRADPRRAIHVFLSPARPTSTASAELAPGIWEVAWPSYHRQPRFDAKPGDKVELALETSTGRCDAGRGQCKLVTASSNTRVRISRR